MKILFCSPYGEGTNSVIGGISIWGKNILSYANSQQTDIELTPISFDRQSYNGSHTNVIERLYFGIKELSKAIRKAKNALDKCQYDVIHICSSASYSLLKDLALIYEAHKHHTKAVVHFHFGRIPELSQKGNWEWKLLIKVITDAATFWKQNPFFGIGLNLFSVKGAYGAYAHNNYLELLATTGIVGFISYYTYHIKTIYNLSKTVKYNQSNNIFGLLIIASMMFYDIGAVSYNLPLVQIFLLLSCKKN